MRRDPDEERRHPAASLAKANDLVARQERRIELLRASGRDPTIAAAMLRVLQQTREVMRKNVDAVEAEIIEKSE
jgi:hypothetical protein